MKQMLFLFHFRMFLSLKADAARLRRSGFQKSRRRHAPTKSSGSIKLRHTKHPLGGEIMKVSKTLLLSRALRPPTGGAHAERWSDRGHSLAACLPPWSSIAGWTRRSLH